MFAEVQVGQFSTGGVGQFYSGANTNTQAGKIDANACLDEIRD
jgi:hypothetical protein